MAAITRRHFETGTITGNDGFNSVAGSPTIDSSSKIKGINSARTNWSASANVNGVVSGLTASEFWIQFYVHVASYPSATARVVSSSNGSTQFNITMTSAGAMTLRNNTTNLASNFMTASLNTTYRIGIRFKKESSLGAADGVIELYHATGDNAFSTADYSSSAYSMNTSANAISSISFGQSNGAAATGDIYWDAICLDDAAMPATGDATLLDGLVGYWKLDETSGSRSDSAGSNTLTDNNTVTSTTGKQGNAATFTRANSEALSITDNTALSMGDIFVTIAYWARLASKPIDGDGNMAAVSKWNYNNSNREYSTGYNNANDKFNISVTGDGSTQTHLYATTFGSPSLNTWYFVVVQHDPNANTIGISVNNGTMDTTSYSSGIFNGTASFAIGAMFASSDLYWNGDIDEVGIWKRKLSSSEITTLYNSGNGKTYPFSSNTDTPMTVNITITETFVTIKQVAKPITIVITDAFSVNKAIGVIKQFNSTGIITALKNISKPFTFTSTVAVGKTSEIGKPIPITSTETVSLQRQIGKTITQVVTSVVSILYTLALYKTIEIVSSISSVIQKNIVKPIAVVEAVIVSPSKAFSRTIEILSTAIINSSVGRGYLQTIEVVASTSVAFDKTLNKVIAIIEGVTVDIQKLLSLSINVSISTPITLSVHKSIQLTKSFIANLSFIFSKSTLDRYVNVYIKRNVGTLTLILKNSVAALLGKNARTITIEGKNDDNN